MRGWLSGAFLILAMLGSYQSQVWAQDGTSELKSAPEWAEDGRNKLAVFVGLTDAAGELGPSLGIDYEYRFTRLFGLGGTIEYTGADLRESLVVVTFDWHTWREMKIFVAPGVEIEREDGTDMFVVRAGVEYGFPMGKDWEVMPTLILDFTSDNTAVVIGASFGRSF